MKSQLLDLICCPACHGALTVSETNRREPEIWCGQLICQTCSATYPIQDGLAHLYVDDEEWAPKRREAAGWVQIHKNMGIYDVVADSVDLKIPYFHEEPWRSIAPMFDLALDTLNLTGNETILDLGAGRGWAAKAFAQRGCRVVALDVTHDNNIGLGRARALMDDAGVYFDRIIGDGENLPLRAETFDIVFSAAALHHFSRLDVVCQHIAKVLRPNGRLCAINEPCLSMLHSEQYELQRSAQDELDLGINETRPNLYDYQQHLQKANLTPIHMTPSKLLRLSTADAEAWARASGLILPRLSLRHPITTLKQSLVFWARRGASLLRYGIQLPQILRHIAAIRGNSLPTKALIWQGGDIFILAQK